MSKFYANRYASMYKPDLSFMRETPQNDADARARANAMKMLGQAAPLAGSAVGGAIGFAAGGPAGMTTGAGMGKDVGGVVGSAVSNGADSTLDPIRERELRKQALMQLIRGG